MTTPAPRERKRKAAEPAPLLSPGEANHLDQLIETISLDADHPSVADSLMDQQTTALLYGAGMVRQFLQEMERLEQNCEFEVRLGKMVSGKFGSGVDKTFFSKMLSMVEKQLSMIDHEVVDWSESEVRYYPDYIRSHHVRGESAKYERSQRYNHRDLWYDGAELYDLRFAIKGEAVFAVLPGNIGNVLSRRLKKRKSFRCQGIRIDFTVASLLSKKSADVKESYEIEMELENTKVDPMAFFQQAVRLLGKGDRALAMLRP